MSLFTLCKNVLQKVIVLIFDDVIAKATINTHRTAVSPTLDLLCHEDFNVGRSEAESNIEIFMAQ